MKSLKKMFWQYKALLARAALRVRTGLWVVKRRLELLLFFGFGECLLHRCQETGFLLFGDIEGKSHVPGGRVVVVFRPQANIAGKPMKNFPLISIVHSISSPTLSDLGDSTMNPPALTSRGERRTSEMAGASIRTRFEYTGCR